AFKRAFKKHVRREPQLQGRILRVIEQLAEDPFAPNLRSHKLSGQLDGLWACSVEYDCRIIFAFIADPDTPNEQALVLLNLGNHDEVY
ncbi:MAG: type II toxin-antitoxin system RelE/ParE family toxin, partial [Blastocatellia bacterium]